MTWRNRSSVYAAKSSALSPGIPRLPVLAGLHRRRPGTARSEIYLRSGLGSSLPGRSEHFADRAWLTRWTARAERVRHAAPDVRLRCPRISIRRCALLG